MSFGQNLNCNSGSSLCELSTHSSSPVICTSQSQRGREEKTHHLSMPIANKSPEQRLFKSSLSMSGGSPPDYSITNQSDLSTASSPYLSCSSLSMPRFSPPRFSATSPSRYTTTDSPTGLLTVIPSSDSLLDFSLGNVSSQCFSGGSPPSLSSTSPPSLSSLSGPSSSDSGINGSPPDSEYLNLAVALRNMEVEINQRIIVPSCENDSPEHKSRERSSPYATSTGTYENQIVIPTAQKDISGTPSIRHSFPSTEFPSHCPRNIHAVKHIRYCLTCSHPFCEECSILYHGEHTYANYVEFLELARRQAIEAMNFVRIGLNILQTDLEDIQLDTEMLDQKAKQAADEVRLYTRRLVTAIEAREKELLTMIEKARVQKFSNLKTKDEHLRNDKARLTKIAYKLTNVLDSCSLATNPKHILASKDMALSEMFQIDHSRRYQSTREENWISFTGPGNNLLQTITTLGNIVTNNPGPIGEGRTVYNDSLQSYFPCIQRIPSTTKTSTTRDRTIPANSFPAVRERQLYVTGKIIRVIGENGDTSDNTLCRPWGVACDKHGHIVIADRSNNRIMIYRENGEFVRKFGSQGIGPGQFDRPAGIVVDSRQRIIVADKDNHRIQILRMDGTFVHHFGQKGYRGGQFNYPWDVAVNSECQIAVSDTRNHRVQLFSPDGVFLYKYGYDSTPNMWKHFDSPRGVSFTPEGNLVTTDFNNHHLVVIDSRFMNARTLICETTDGSNRPFQRPQGLVIDSNGNIIVADSRNHRIQVFDSTGRFLWKYGTQGTNINEMDRPAGVALLPDGKIAIVDFGNNRVLLLEYNVDEYRQ